MFSVEKYMDGVSSQIEQKKKKESSNINPNSINQISLKHGISPSTVKARMKKGLTLEEAVSLEVKNKECIDHLGNKYKNITDMCNHYNITTDTYYYRIKAGWSIENALLAKKSEKALGITCQDHLGTVYSSKSEMCKKYGINRCTFNQRIKNGWSLEDALTKVTEKNKP